MGIKKTAWLFCDGCGDQYPNNGESTKEVRKAAKKDGWKYTKFTGDKCPDCIQSDHEDWVNSVRPSA